MTRSATISEVRSTLTKLPDTLRKDAGTIEITQRGTPVMALLSWSVYESIIETLEVLADENVLKALRKSVRELKRGRTYSTEEVERRLGL